MDVEGAGREPQTLSPHKVAVVGTGKLGIRIAGELALCGCTVRIHDHNPVNLQTVHSRIAEDLEELRYGGLLPQHYQLPGSVIVESVLSRAVSDADLVIEAVVEDLEVKNSLFRDISSLCSEGTILSTNSLNLSLEDVFHGVSAPERTLGVRFLYPVYFINRVEITEHHYTSSTTTERVRLFLLGMDKSVFSRGTGESPVRLPVQQAIQLQRKNSLVAKFKMAQISP